MKRLVHASTLFGVYDRVNDRVRNPLWAHIYGRVEVWVRDCINGYVSERVWARACQRVWGRVRSRYLLGS